MQDGPVVCLSRMCARMALTHGTWVVQVEFSRESSQERERVSLLYHIWTQISRTHGLNHQT